METRKTSGLVAIHRLTLDGRCTAETYWYVEEADLATFLRVIAASLDVRNTCVTFRGEYVYGRSVADSMHRDE